MDSNLSNNIYNYIEGNTNKLLSSINLRSQYYIEQIQYRSLICSKDCIPQGKCIKCGCSTPGRLYTTKTCNSDRFPDIMNEQQWEQFKRDNYDKDIYLQELKLEPNS